MQAYASHSHKNIFSVRDLDVEAVAKGFGFSTPPRVHLNFKMSDRDKKGKRKGNGNGYGGAGSGGGMFGGVRQKNHKRREKNGSDFKRRRTGGDRRQFSK